MQSGNSLQSGTAKRSYPQNRDNRETERHEESGPRNYRQPDPLNCGLEGKSITLTMSNGRTESGILKVMGQYSIEIEFPSKKTLIVNKSAIITVSVIP